jgi:hypothetical protein
MATKFITIIFFAILLVSFNSCSSMTANQVQRSTFSLEGGRDNKEEWHDKWDFKRVSWMQELTLMVDLYYADLRSESKFYKWLSVSDKKIVENCRDYFYALLYIYEPSKISENEFIAQMRAQGYDDITLGSINSQMHLHPQFNENSFGRYKLKAFCSTKKSTDQRSIIINFPGFTETSL